MIGEWKSEEDAWHFIPWPSGPDNSSISRAAWFAMITGGPSDREIADDGRYAEGEIWFIRHDVDGKPEYLHNEQFALYQDMWKGWEVPGNTSQISVHVTKSGNSIGYCLEVAAK